MIHISQTSEYRFFSHPSLYPTIFTDFVAVLILTYIDPNLPMTISSIDYSSQQLHLLKKEAHLESLFDMLRYYKLYFYYHFIHKSLPLFIFHKIA